MSTQISYQKELLRKAIHISSLWMVISMALLAKSTNILLFGVLLAGCILIEYGYHKQWCLFTLTYGTLFSGILREKEKQQGAFRLSGAPYVLGAALLCTVLFPKVIAMSAFTVMLLGDTAAALIGRRFGRNKFNLGTKSIEGSLAFFWTGYIVVVFFHFFFQMHFEFALFGIIGVVAATFAEAYENRIHLDDNFSIPLVSGAIMSLSLFF